jgi:Zn-finger nucleic acid-binding protein
MVDALMETHQDQNTEDLRAETQGAITFYHMRSHHGFWFSAGELEAMIEERIVLSLPEPFKELTLAQEFADAPAHCPRCGTSSRLFEMKCFVGSDVRMMACHVCHGRWIGHHSLTLLMFQVRHRGLFGSITKLFVRKPDVRV